MILLDTQVLVWLVLHDSRLGRTALSTLRTDEDLRMSAMLSWEVAMAVDKRRLLLQMPFETWLDSAIASTNIIEIPVTGAIARDAGSLDGPIHGDPCDRIMIATARALGCPLMTADRKILTYAAAGHLKAIDARR